VRPDLLALLKASDHIVVWLSKLEPQLDDGDPEIRREYVALVATLAAITPQIQPEATGALLSTKDMAARLGIKPKTLLRQKALGKITPTQILGKRGTAAFRWAAR
jgi:hypothetical protein